MHPVSWDELGKPAKEGWYDVAGIGTILVTEKNIGQAEAVDGKVAFDLIDVSSAKCPLHFQLGAIASG